jgi:hypothetical protein
VSPLKPGARNAICRADKKHQGSQNMPRRSSAIGAILFGAIAASQFARIFYVADITVNSYHVPMGMSYVLAGVTALMCIALFRESNS